MATLTHMPAAPEPPAGPGLPAAQPPSTPHRPALRALVVDDEVPAQAELAWLLGQDERIGEVRTASSGADALRALDAAPADVLFCDIRMPGLDGMELARVLARFAEPPQLVFVTASEEHALSAFEVAAVDYVVKPVRPARLAEAVGRVVERHRARDTAPVGAASTAPIEDDETLPVELGGVTTFVQRSEVRYVQAHGDYARLHTTTSSHLVRLSLNYLEERWAQAGFARIHRSTLVYLPAVTQVRGDRGRWEVQLDDVTLQVSRRHARELRDRLLRLPSR